MYFGPLGGIQHSVCLFWPQTILWDLFLEYLRNVALQQGVAFKYIFCSLDIEPVKSHLPELSVSFLTYITTFPRLQTKIGCQYLVLIYGYFSQITTYLLNESPTILLSLESLCSVIPHRASHHKHRFYCGQECEFEEAPVVRFTALSCCMGSHQENKPWF